MVIGGGDGGDADAHGDAGGARGDAGGSGELSHTERGNAIRALGGGGELVDLRRIRKGGQGAGLDLESARSAINLIALVAHTGVEEDLGYVVNAREAAVRGVLSLAQTASHRRHLRESELVAEPVSDQTGEGGVVKVGGPIGSSGVLAETILHAVDLQGVSTAEDDKIKSTQRSRSRTERPWISN